MRVDEFIVWDDGSGDKHQLVDGEVRAMAPTTEAHGTIQANLARLIGNRLVATDSPYRIVMKPGVTTRIRADWNMRVPDLGVTCARAEPGQIALIEPVLLVEIMSPGKKNATWENVWAYAAIPSVREILVVQLTRIEAALLRRTANGEWPANPDPIGSHDMVRLETVGLETPLTESYRGTYLAG